mmetsp:Transcript_4218/g.17814  ORF Transcript_4218/g.17814 Transcript_4218/m.17814 type:complete len:570 (-) Transcript_4218:260-1969(-)
MGSACSVPWLHSSAAVSPQLDAYSFPPRSTALAAFFSMEQPRWIAERALGSASLLTRDSFTWNRVLAYGGTAVLKASLHKGVDRVFAVKAIDKGVMFSHKLGPSVRREVVVQSYLNGLDRFATRLFNVTEDDTSLLLVMELAPGGTLRDVVKRCGGRLSEDAAKFYVAELAQALGILHESGFLHGDIKPRNICLDAGGHVKLVDFGSARRVLQRVSGEFAKLPPDGTQWITPDFAAPELVSRDPYTPAVDWFSLGAVMFELLTGSPPFRCAVGVGAQCDVGANVRSGSRGPLPRTLSEEGADFLTALLRQQPERRLSFDGIRSHRWMAGVDWSRVRARTYRAPFVPELRFRGDTRYFPGTGKPARFRGRGAEPLSMVERSYASVKNFPLCSEIRASSVGTIGHSHSTPSMHHRLSSSASGSASRAPEGGRSRAASAAQRRPSTGMLITHRGEVQRVATGSSPVITSQAEPHWPAGAQIGMTHSAEASELQVIRPFASTGQGESTVAAYSMAPDILTTVSGSVASSQRQWSEQQLSGKPAVTPSTKDIAAVVASSRRRLNASQKPSASHA